MIIPSDWGQVNAHRSRWNRSPEWVHNAPMRFRSIARALAVIPPRPACLIAGLVSPWLGLAAPRRRRSWIANLRDLGFERGQSLGHWPRPFYHLLLLLYEALARIGGRRFVIRLEGEKHLLDAIGRDRGVIVASCHLGNWLLGAEAAASLTGRAVHSVAGVQILRGWTADLRLGYRALGVRIHGARRPAATLLRALRRGEIVALQIDGDRHEGSGNLATRGIRTLAARTGAAIIPAACVRESPGRFAVRFQAAISESQTAATDRLLRESMRDAVSGAPHQWILFRRVEAGG